jgi:hypothetical protein
MRFVGYLLYAKQKQRNKNHDEKEQVENIVREKTHFANSIISWSAASVISQEMREPR